MSHDKSPPLARGALLLRAFLDERGLGPTAAAKAIGCTHPAVIEWLSGRKRPNAEMREAIAIWTSEGVPSSSWVHETDRERLDALKPFGADLVQEAPAQAPDTGANWVRVCDCEKAKGSDPKEAA